MSEDDTTALEQDVLEAEAAEREAFEARLPPRDFLGVAKALNIRDPAIFARLVRSLRDDFYEFHWNCRGKRPSRAAEMQRLRELRDAANLLASGDLGLPLDLLDEEEQFVATAKRLATLWDGELRELEVGPSAAGRPSHDAFRELIICLIRTYQRVAERPAKRPSSRRNKTGYFGDFYQFAIASWHCLRERLPETRNLIPASEGALGEALRDHWPKKNTTGYKLILYLSK